MRPRRNYDTQGRRGAKPRCTGRSSTRFYIFSPYHHHCPTGCRASVPSHLDNMYRCTCSPALRTLLAASPASRTWTRAPRQWRTLTELSFRRRIEPLPQTYASGRRTQATDAAPTKTSIDSTAKLPEEKAPGAHTSAVHLARLIHLSQLLYSDL